MRAVRPVRRVRVYSVPAESAEEFAEREARLTGLPVEAVATAEEAVAGADLICTTTTATEPVVLGAWVSPGAHVNAVGAYTPTTRELDSELVAEGAALRRQRESLLSEAGEFLIPKSEGLDRRRAPRRRARRGAHRQGATARTSPDEVTLFKSLGIAIEDLASAHRIYEICKERELGTWVDIGGLHFGKAVEG